MSYKAGRLTVTLLILAILCLLASHAAQAGGFWALPPEAPASEYGNLLINRNSEKNGQKAVLFSHWVHRTKFTCRVCHFELEFNMKANTTEITEATNRSGLHCGAASCHDGKAAFGHEEPYCEKCHTGDKNTGGEKFNELASRLPKSPFGNHIDWDKALNKGMINPAHYISIKPPKDIEYKDLLVLDAKWTNIPPAIFPHRQHIQWLDCNNCHPDIFNIKKKTTKHFEMVRILNGEFCGVCHMTVAFPMGNCQLCHPGIQKR
jgi:c(7)-type cytochrome triheme protein